MFTMFTYIYILKLSFIESSDVNSFFTISLSVFFRSGYSSGSLNK